MTERDTGQGAGRSGMGLGGGLVTGALTGAAVVAAVAAALGLVSPRPASPPPDAAPDPAPLAAAPPAPQPAPAARPVPAPTDAPAFDLVRVAPASGLVTVAGTAPPDADVVVLVDGHAVHELRAGADGRFAALFTIPPSAVPRAVTLEAQGTDGVRIPSDQTLLIGPVPGAAPDPAPDDTPDPGRGAPPAAETAHAPPAAVAGPADAAANPAPGVRPAAVAEPLSEPLPEPLPEPMSELARRVAPAPEPAAAADGGAAGPEPAAAATPAPSPDQAPDPGRAAVVEPAPGALARPVAEPSPAAPVPGAEPMAVPAPGLVGTAEDLPTPTLGAVAPPMLLVEGTAARPLPVPPRPGQAEGPANVLVEAISYGADGDVQLAGRATTPDSAVRVYLDNALRETLPVDASGAWAGAIPRITAGDYTLRVDEIDAAGAVVSRFETPFRREDAARVSALGPAPARGARARVITVQPGSTLWGISRDAYGAGTLYVQLFEANRALIRDPDLIFPGQVFELPDLPAGSGSGAAVPAPPRP
ncbi:MAG: LysM peptidoglycan-binding domain-containing protein [Alkalilacustris sp.]